jgi:hypothetical protein
MDSPRSPEQPLTQRRLGAALYEQLSRYHGGGQIG